MQQKYNGWTNYETWRVMLELFNEEDFKEYNVEMLKEYVEEVLEQECDNTLTISYALAFINNVNFFEIYEHTK